MLLERKELPLTLVVLVEVQQFLKNDPGRVLCFRNAAANLLYDGVVDTLVWSVQKSWWRCDSFGLPAFSAGGSL